MNNNSVHEEDDFIGRQRAFIEGLRRDSLAAGAIPNPHVLGKIPTVKKLRYLVYIMFHRGLPQGWGK